MDDLYGHWDQSFWYLYNFKAEVELRDPSSFVEIDIKRVKAKVYFHILFLH